MMIYRSAGHTCPQCGVKLEEVDVGSRRFERCTGCRGIWIKAEVLANMLAEMTTGSLELADPTLPPAEPERGCCSCSKRMAKRVLFEVVVDACDDHGVWFDGTELEVMLATAAGVEFEVGQGKRPSADQSLLTDIFGG